MYSFSKSEIQNRKMIEIITLLAAGASFDRDVSSFEGSAHGSRCSWTLASLNTHRYVFNICWSTYFIFTKFYRFNVTSVPVNFLHRLNADSKRSGSSFKNFSSRTTFSISFDKIFRNPFCSPGNFIFSSATVLLKW